MIDRVACQCNVVVAASVLFVLSNLIVIVDNVIVVVVDDKY